MNDSDSPSFDLATEPWLLARPVGGGVEEVSLREVFARAGEFAGLAGDVPTQVFALTRLLLAVLHDAVQGPVDADAWEQLWAADQLPVQVIDPYLDQHRDRFDLLHPVTPFFQVAGLRTAKDEVSELSKLIADVPNGNPFFTTRHGPLSLSFAEAARWVVHCHAFDPSGIKSGAVGDPRVKGGRGYPIGTGWCGFLGGVLAEGRTLRETLLLNLIARDFGDTARSPALDRPAWRRDPVDATSSERSPDGPVDLFTWQSRRIRLAVTGDRVTGVLICNGDPVAQQNQHTTETHSAWRRSEAQEKKLRSATPVYMPKTHDPERSIWRGLESLLPHSRPSGAAWLAPGVLEWISSLTENESIGDDTVVRVRALAMSYGSQSSTTTEIVDDALDLRAVLLRQDADHLRGIVLACVAAAEQAAGALGTLAGNLARATGGDPDGPRARARETGYAALDPLFRRWISALSASSDPVDAQTRWHTTAHDAVSGLGADLVARVSPVAFTGQVVSGHGGDRLITAAHAERWFHDDLAKSLSYADAVTSRTGDADMSTTEDTEPESGVTTETTSMPPELTPVGQVVSAKIGRLQQGYLKNTSPAVAALAQLRRAVGTPPGAAVDVLEYTLDPVFAEDAGDAIEATTAETAAHIAMTLYAVHQQSAAAAMHVRGRTLGRAMRKLADVKNLADDPLTRRLTMLCTADSLAEFTHHLRAVVQLLRRDRVPLDYGLLADQLVRWQTDGPDALRLVWSRDYYLSPNVKKN